MKQNYRKILAINLAALMKLTQALRSHAKLARHCSTATRKIGARTIGHLRNWENGPQPQLDTIVAVAEAFKIPPWMLLMPDFDPISKQYPSLPPAEVLDLAKRIAKLSEEKRQLLIEIFGRDGVPEEAVASQRADSDRTVHQNPGMYRVRRRK